MAAIIKTKSVSAVLAGDAGARPVKEGKAEDYMRERIVEEPSISQNTLLAEVSKLFPSYGYSSFKIAFSRYTATMRSVTRKYELKKRAANPAPAVVIKK